MAVEDAGSRAVGAITIVVALLLVSTIALFLVEGMEGESAGSGGNAPPSLSASSLSAREFLSSSLSSYSSLSSLRKTYAVSDGNVSVDAELVFSGESEILDAVVSSPSGSLAFRHYFLGGKGFYCVMVAGNWNCFEDNGITAVPRARETVLYSNLLEKGAVSFSQGPVSRNILGFSCIEVSFSVSPGSLSDAEKGILLASSGFVNFVDIESEAPGLASFSRTACIEQHGVSLVESARAVFSSGESVSLEAIVSSFSPGAPVTDVEFSIP